MTKKNSKSQIVLIGLIFIVFTCNSLYSQFQTDPVRVIQKSPESTAFDQYLNVPVSLATGVPDITIPIYSINVGGLEIPISLSYHASGIKIDDIATPAGLNWVVNAGGRVSRTIIGIDDKEPSKGWLDIDPIDPTGCNGRDDLEPYYKQSIDPAPDLYTYSIPGKSGSFFMDTDGTILKTTVDEVFIQDGTDWNIRDARGNHYKFHDTERSVTTVIRDCNPMTYECVDLSGDGDTGWLLDSIITPTGEIVSFTYTYYTYSTPSVVTSVDYTWSELFGDPGGNADSDDFQTRATNVYYVRILDQIITKKEKIEFSYHTDASYAIMEMILDTIQITDLLNNETTLIAVLSHDKFLGDARLQLTGVQIAGADFTNSKLFTFDYQSGSLPEYGSYKRDIFGYQNNNGAWHMIPSGAGADPTYFQLDDFADREVDPTRILYGILNKVTYPTGGSVKYYYEPNMEERSGIKYYAPGVRVKKIEYIESNDEVIKEEFFTYSGLTSQKEHKEGWFPYHYFVRDPQSVSPTALYAERKFSSNPIPTSEYINKEYNGFYYQTVISNLGSETPNGYYTLNNYNGYLDNFTLQPYLTSQRFVDNENKTVKKVEYFYLDTILNEILASALDLSWTFTGRDIDCETTNGICSAIPLCEEINIHYNPLQELVYTSTEFTKAKETNTEYFNGGTDSICTEQYYYYDISSHLNVDYILQTGVSRYSKTSIETSLIDSTAIKYPKDYTFTGFPDNLENSYIIGVPIDTRLYKDDWGSLRLAAGKTTEYNNYGQPVKEYLWEGNILSSEEWVSNNLVSAVGGFRPRLSYTYDNSTHNLTSYTLKDNNTTSFLWGYNDLLPIAEVINANYADNAYTGFEENGVFEGWNYQSGTRVSTYSRTGKYSCANSIMQRTVSVNSIVSLWAKTGSGTVTISGYTPKIYASTDGWTYYEWSVNPGSITVSCSNGYIDDLRLYPVGASMTTYTYNPLIGMSSMTDHNGIITRYEYDSFGRLENVRDNNGSITARNYYHYYNNPSSDPPYLNTSPTSLSFGSSASSSNLSISSNSTWSITDNASWLTVNTTSGSGNATLTVSVTTNTGAVRNATITITYSGGLTKTVTVTQAAGSSSSLTVNYQSIDFESIAPPVLVTVTSNTSWTVTKSASWITLSATSGTGNGTVGIGAQNLDVGTRTGTVTFKTTDNTVTRIIQISQNGLMQ